MSIAFIFPGQGSQSVGMLGSIAGENPEYGEIITSTFQQASDRLGVDLWNLVQNGPESQLNITKNTQPAMLAAGYALWQIWCSKEGSAPAVMAGHSLGEYTALVCSEALDFSDAIDLVSSRGRYMQDAIETGDGAMAAILGLDDDAVIKVCEEIAEDSGRVVSAVNFNAPGQVVIAGHSDAVEQAVNSAKNTGAKKAIKLAVSVPSHCSLMQGAAERLAKKLESINIERPVIPVINNVHVTIENESDSIRDSLVKQLSHPVRWVETINKMAAEGTKQIVECGPGKVLTGLNRRINRQMPAHAMFDTATIDKVFEELS
ncbi:MAG: ACP S-malonyltransferase [gamma proteobacterium symbiont of Bathyaustriella thionipta]|nr:ACP S-malonyltransferase [gamma proteobacterium symbiont of Bathyaustriella thionipta]MCU7949125.1 ACP S-malonyltransferase [gamma proteobacterium symbiont of Bathyaustriella thionipta]MCU7954436.1 ACP S-malonyltransferase [gamma proteobacterium symbiont of Bathyaustriella thionipta]MCU7955702.1 ACP S-malonyltransferase [gamma proteobacterium symbiont of Bathyaustriella thionipta]MCU7966204.1 ACP S-malonyltransferase [gamma proteobacterium symbiont of Bathyaustriella thionipta]